MFTLDAETLQALIEDARRAEEDFLAAMAAMDAEQALREAPRVDVQPDTVSDEEWLYHFIS